MGGLEAHALRHLVAAAELGAARRATMGDLHVSIGQVAAELGQTGLAKKHYGEFLRLFPNDPRTYTINSYLKKLTDPQ